MKNPFPATVLGVRPVTKPGSAKETIHVDYSLEGSGLSYTTGDALGVLPNNDPAVVDQLIAALGLDAAATVALPDGSVSSLRDALISTYDISTLKKGVLSKWNAVAGSEKLAAIIEDKEALKDFVWGRDVLDLALDPETKATFADATAFVACLGKMTPRLYSIASSPDAVPGQVSLCVGAVRYTSKATGRARAGVCSTFMADRISAGDKVKVFVHSNKNFRLPEDGTTPVIMVGPGTGIAPFRAFWQQRVADNATGPMWLFFGNPYKATDSCYEDELEPLVASGKLKLSVAWSRDQEYKIYVQHLMEQAGEEVWQWLENGAAFYMCGDANRMAKDVEAALLAIIAKYGNRSAEEAAAYLADMKAAKRYQKDVY
ncbi:MAG: sulfite reductase subunit alpha [Akkermansia sp.]|nr:sulfite reductase subunit alpha [Akkermansia sp.]